MKLCENCGAPIGNEMLQCCEAMTPRHGTARSDAESVRCSALLGGASLWSAVPPRAGGLWWWWDGNRNRKAELVEVTYDAVVAALYGSGTFQFHGLTRVRVCGREGGWWCGPVKPPELPTAPAPPNRELADETLATRSPESK